MKQLTLLFALTCFFFAGYGQYFPGQRFVGAGKIPGLLAQLKNNPSNSQKANLLLDIGYGYLCKAGEAKEDLDSALNYSLQLTDLRTRMKNAT
jgi:two-component system, sensor histidine kinase PdtaS